MLYLRAAFTSDFLFVSLVLHFPAVTSPLQTPFSLWRKCNFSLPPSSPPTTQATTQPNKPNLHATPPHQARRRPEGKERKQGPKKKNVITSPFGHVCCSGRTGKANKPFICRAGLNPGSTALGIGGCLNLRPSISFRHLNSRAQKKPTQANTVEWPWLPLFLCRIDEKDVCDVRLIYSHSPSPRLLD